MSGIYFESKGGKESCFDDLRIENCHVARTDRNGICQRRSNGAGRSLHVVIRGNVLEISAVTASSRGAPTARSSSTMCSTGADAVPRCGGRNLALGLR